MSNQNQQIPTGSQADRQTDRLADRQHNYQRQQSNKRQSAKSSSLPDLMVPLVFSLATLICALFALGVLGLPSLHIENQLDSQGNSYVGEQNPLNAQFVGPVRITFASQEIYEGEFSKNRFNGYGKFTGKDVAAPAGDFASENEESQSPSEQNPDTGVSENQDASPAQSAKVWTLEGNFVEGRLVGEGIYQDSDGRYVGTFENSLPHGPGVYTANAGWRYEGNFTMGLMTGYGTVHTPEGQTMAGNWVNGVLID